MSAADQVPPEKAGLPENGGAGERQPVHRRRPRYAGKYPRRFEEKYKEHDPSRYADTIAKVIASGKTPAGSHRSILVAEMLEAVAPRPGDIAVDCTLGYGGHAQELLPRLLPGGHLIGLDADPIELPKAESRLRAAGFGPDVFTARRSNFAGLAQVLGEMARVRSESRAGQKVGAEDEAFLAADIIVADLGVSSMQIDDPSRGFSVKLEGPLDMRMNPQRGQPASALLEKIRPEALAELLSENADEPEAVPVSQALAGRKFATTVELARAIRSIFPRAGKDTLDLTIRRVFQALRIAVNEEFSALETLLRNLPGCLRPGGRVAILTFHSGEDRRVKKAFEIGLHAGLYADIAREVIRPSPAERNSNPRSAPAKLRWARRAA